MIRGSWSVSLASCVLESTEQARQGRPQHRDGTASAGRPHRRLTIRLCSTYTHFKVFAFGDTVYALGNKWGEKILLLD